MSSELTHLDGAGDARMVDVGDKAVTRREAEAEGELIVSAEVARRLRQGSVEKGDVFAAARLAGIQAAKRTAEWIPLCHAVPLDAVEVELRLDEAAGTLRIRSRVRARWTTGVEMEALTAVAAAALTVYDMCKALDRGMEIRRVALLRKTGGRSGEFRRAAAPSGVDKGGTPPLG